MKVCEELPNFCRKQKWHLFAETQCRKCADRDKPVARFIHVGGDPWQDPIMEAHVTIPYDIWSTNVTSLWRR